MIRRTMTLAVALAAACGPGKSDDTETGEPTTAATTETDPPATGTTTSTGDPPTGTTDTTTTGTTDSSTTAEPTTTLGTTGDSEDFDQLGACAVAMVCEQFLHDDGEIQGHQEGPEGFLDVERCILTGLRDGTPGFYVYGVNSVFANGDEREVNHIIVHADRTVTFASHFKGSFFDADTDSSTEVFEPARTCTLVAAPFFDNCFENHDDWTHYSECMKIEKWWTDCVAMGPRCE